LLQRWALSRSVRRHPQYESGSRGQNTIPSVRAIRIAETIRRVYDLARQIFPEVLSVTVEILDLARA
jgi:hypothetical protein